MKKFVLTFSILCAFGALTYAGTERYSGNEKETIQQAPPPCEWYRAHEWDFEIWGAYAFADNTGHRNDFRPGDFDAKPDFNQAEHFDIGQWGSDRFINRDTAAGGGADIKFFFNKYWALGVEGLILDTNFNEGGAGLGTFTFRFPIGCSRFAPYVYLGGGALGGGSHTVRFFNEANQANKPLEPEFRANQAIQNKHAEAVGQVGAGLEVRITRHIGIMSDYSWLAVSGPDNNFGMARAGITLSY